MHTQVVGQLIMTMDKSLHCSKDVGLNRGAWTAQEDFVLRSYISVHGEGQWSSIPFKAGELNQFIHSSPPLLSK